MYSVNQPCHSELADETAKRLLYHLDGIKISPKIIINLDANFGDLNHRLIKRYPNSFIINTNISSPLLKNQSAENSCQSFHSVNHSYELLPFKKNSADLICINLYFLFYPDIELFLQELKRILKPNGLILFSTLGLDTLRELRQSWIGIDNFEHIQKFMDMHDIGDLLLKVGFVDPVVASEFNLLQYTTHESAFKDIKENRMINFVSEQGLTGKMKFKQFIHNYEKHRNSGGKLPLTLEIIYGHAWGTAISSTEKDEVIISIDTIKVTI